MQVKQPNDCQSESYARQVAATWITSQFKGEH